MKQSFRRYILTISILGLFIAPIFDLYAETFLTPDEAKKVLWQDEAMQAVPVVLTEAQMKSIKSASKTRVRTDKVNSWKTETGGWFILDQVVGKHEMIDIAVALTHEGKVKGIKVLTYRETYGDEVKNPKWLAQFINKDNSEVLKLDKQIVNISGATLSSRHITDGINRLTHTWDQVLQHK